MGVSKVTGLKLEKIKKYEHQFSNVRHTKVNSIFPCNLQTCPNVYCNVKQVYLFQYSVFDNNVNTYTEF